MDENQKKTELKIELSPDIASGVYTNLAVISHTANEFFFDFITVAPNAPQAKVRSRVVMNPENAKNLFFALRDNLQKYEQTFGEIERKQPLNQNNNGGIPNPFLPRGNA